jgi:iron complex outermembrane receptor protein
MSTEQQPATGWSAWTIALCAIVLAFAGSGARAQESTSDPAQQPPAAEATAEDEEKMETVGEEIVVTARKREENLQEVPIAVTAVTGDRLEEFATADISELQTQVPNLAIYQGRNQSTTLTAFLRGVGQADPLWGVDPGVGLYFDDVYIARAQGGLLDVFDAGQIEVLRGPQGTLYGKNTIGGAIKYRSRPIGEERAGQISITGGSYNNQDVRASFSGTLVEGKLLGKIALASLKHDGYGENRFTGRDVSDRNTFAARGGLEWLASEDVRVAFSLDMTRDDAEPKGYQRLQANQFCPLFLGTTCPPLDDRWDTQSGLAPVNGTDSDGGSMVISWNMNDAWSFKSISAYRQTDSDNNIDFDTTPARIVDVSATYFDDQLTQEFQFIYTGERLSGVLGAYYFDGEAGGLVKNIFLNGIAPTSFGTTNGRTLTDSIAIFGDGTWALTDATNLNFGLRATREKKNGIAFNALYTNDTFSTVRVVLSDYDKEETFDSIAPRLGIDHRFTDDVMGYFSLSRGFKSGGFNVRAQAAVFPQSAEPFDDEVLDVAELGLKSVLANGSLVLNTAYFYGKYQDIQVSTFTAYDSDADGVEDAFFGNFLNAGDATMQGIELEFDWTSPSVEWLGFSGFASWLDVEPDEFLDANHDGFVDTVMITNAPEYTGGLRANLDFQAWGGLLTAFGGAAYRDDADLTNEGGQYPGRPGVPLLPISQEAYWLYDAGINWLSPGANWRFGIVGKNLADEEYLTNGYNIPSLGVVTGSYGAPLTVLATVEYRFF